jgi:hypothetical protein
VLDLAVAAFLRALRRCLERGVHGGLGLVVQHAPLRERAAVKVLAVESGERIGIPAWTTVLTRWKRGRKRRSIAPSSGAASL